jgi:hypothetical protein
MNSPNKPIGPGESDITPEAFSLIWLNAVDPRIFTPHTWAKGRETTIRLRSADNNTRVNVQRIVSHYIDGEAEMVDEVYSVGDSETGAHDVTRFKYTVSEDGGLTGFDPTLSFSDHARDMVNEMSGLVHIPGSRIEADNYRVGRESSYISDGTQWIDPHSSIPIAALPAITMGQPELSPPAASEGNY